MARASSWYSSKTRSSSGQPHSGQERPVSASAKAATSWACQPSSAPSRSVAARSRPRASPARSVVSCSTSIGDLLALSLAELAAGGVEDAEERAAPARLQGEVVELATAGQPERPEAGAELLGEPP